MKMNTVQAAADNGSSEHDRELLLAVAAGDRRALGELYLRHAPRLAHFASRIARGPVYVEAIVNDTFMTVWGRAQTFCNSMTVSSWIMAITYRISVQFLDRARHAASPWPPRLAESAFARTRDLHASLRIEEILMRMTPEQRLAVELAYSMGCSLAEIAAITGSSVETVNVRLFHARNKLRQYRPGLCKA